MKANTRSKPSGRAKKTPPERRAQINLDQDRPNDAVPDRGYFSCAPGLRLSSIARWPCPGCQVEANHPYLTARCPFEPAVAWEAVVKVRRCTETSPAPEWQGAESDAYWTYARASNEASRDAGFVECRPTFTTGS